MKTGILGGTFDPVHNGHIVIAREAFRQLDLDEMLLIPARVSPFKKDSIIAPVEDRLKMVELAIAGMAGFRISRIEIDREGTSYTVDTLETLKNTSQDENELYFIVGIDSLTSLPQWKDSERIVKMCRLVTLRRPGYDMPDVDALEERVPGLKERLIVLDGPLIDISSTDIRHRIEDGEPVGDMIPAGVEQHIRDNGLYKKGK